MDYSSITLFGLMKSKLAYLSQRQAVIAQNIANASTPGYKTRDTVEPDFKKMMQDSSKGSAQKLQLAVTIGNHIAGIGSANQVARTMQVKNTGDTAPNGNNVVIEEEMAKMSMNQADYQKVIGMYGKMITMFKTAIGSASGA